MLILAMSMVLNNGCTEKKYLVNCKKEVCKYPTLPTFKYPKKEKFTPLKINKNTILVSTKELTKVFNTNKKLRNVCWKYTLSSIRYNKTFKNDKKLP